jgi:hypothetical protein
LTALEQNGVAPVEKGGHYCTAKNHLQGYNQLYLPVYCNIVSTFAFMLRHDFVDFHTFSSDLSSFTHIYYKHRDDDASEVDAFSCTEQLLKGLWRACKNKDDLNKIS